MKWKRVAVWLGSNWFRIVALILGFKLLEAAHELDSDLWSIQNSVGNCAVGIEEANRSIQENSKQIESVGTSIDLHR